MQALLADGDVRKLGGVKSVDHQHVRTFPQRVGDVKGKPIVPAPNAGTYDGRCKGSLSRGLKTLGGQMCKVKAWFDSALKPPASKMHGSLHAGQ